MTIQRTCPRCNGSGYDPEPVPVCCGRGTVHGCCGDPEMDFGPCRDCQGEGVVEIGFDDLNGIDEYEGR